MKFFPLIFCAVLAGCVQKPPVGPAPIPRYLIGGGYKAGNYWFYPAENFAFDETGIAAVLPPGRGDYTANGEKIDDTALTAAMQTLQLPSIVTVTNLENGLQLQVRVNDRGPQNPGRMIALSPRAASLLHIDANTPARVRVTIDQASSHQLVDNMTGGPKLAIATVAPSSVTAEDLPPPGQAGASAASHVIGMTAASEQAPAVPDHLPEILRRVPVSAGLFYLEAGHFSRARYAVERSARLSGLGSAVQSQREGRDTVFSVRAGPYFSVREADQALAEAFARGVIDARITVE
jgi:rare lipoprotein A